MIIKKRNKHKNEVIPENDRRILIPIYSRLSTQHKRPISINRFRCQQTFGG